MDLSLDEPIEWTAKVCPLPTKMSWGETQVWIFCKFEIHKIIWWHAHESANHAWEPIPCGTWSTS